MAAATRPQSPPTFAAARPPTHDASAPGSCTATAVSPPFVLGGVTAAPPPSPRLLAATVCVRRQHGERLLLYSPCHGEDRSTDRVTVPTPSCSASGSFGARQQQRVGGLTGTVLGRRGRRGQHGGGGSAGAWCADSRRAADPRRSSGAAPTPAAHPPLPAPPPRTADAAAQRGMSVAAQPSQRGQHVHK